MLKVRSAYKQGGEFGSTHIYIYIYIYIYRERERERESLRVVFFVYKNTVRAKGNSL